MTDDRTLVNRVLSGEKSALKALIRQHERLVAHMVGRLVKGEEDREEICQDVFLKVFEKLPGFGFQSKLSTWIATIAYRQAINHLRKQGPAFQEIPEEEGWSDRFVEHSNPAEILAARDENEVVMGYVEQLPAAYKGVLTLYHLEGMSYEEIGAALQMPEGTVKNYLFRARKLLKDKVSLHLDHEHHERRGNTKGS